MIRKYSRLGTDLGPNFVKWFGSSQVRTESGEPLVMWHGTSVSNIKKFRPGKSGELGPGIYFTPMREAAYLFGKNLIPVYLSVTPYDLSEFRKNPEKESKFLADKIISRGAVPPLLNGISRQDLAARIKQTWDEPNYRFWVEAAGYNALKDPKSQVPGQIVVWDPTVIKHATENNGGFDPQNPEIRK